ncbi:hypothetical protein HNR46_003149 [Haloferula luteola]|uniref:Spermidine synthase n=1 Tax=Haloferula luteola TaxID=595692 RepID=A0A840VGE4_9BACT|nr:hypothetical protein [Haloferula luteola]MBB5352900.1 hypothetical protein [Haloferula luteola]
MKPRVFLEQIQLPSGATLCLHEHDGRHQLSLEGEPLAGPQTRAGELALAELALSPFRPVRQPVIYLAGLGLGATLAAVKATLPQKKGCYWVAEPCEALPRWVSTHVDPSLLDDPRVILETSISPGDLARHQDEIHAILVHADTAPPAESGGLLVNQSRWLAAAYDALKEGGLLAITALRPIPKLEALLRRAGFEVAHHEIESSPQARRPRRLPLWIARKGKFVSSHR